MATREERRQDVDRRERRGELDTNRQGHLTHYLCVPLQDTHGMVTSGRGDDLDDENGGSTLMHCVCVST